MSDKFRTFAMRFSTSFPPKFTFPGCSEEFLFPLTKIRNVYYIDNQLVIFLSLFHDCPYITEHRIVMEYLRSRSPQISPASTKQMQIKEKSPTFHLIPKHIILQVIQSGSGVKVCVLYIVRDD